MVTGGGGGYGDPFERPVDDVLDEIQGEYISANQALAEYGVALTPDGRGVDRAATARLREQASA
jgi:N-methylhydantoinase B